MASYQEFIIYARFNILSEWSLTIRAVKWRGEALFLYRPQRAASDKAPYSPQTPDKNRLHNSNSHCSFQIFHLYGYWSNGGGLFTKTNLWSGAFNIYQISLNYY